MRFPARRAVSMAIVCLFVWCSAVFGEEDVERMLEMYRQSGSASIERQRDYQALLEMRRARRERHLPAGSQFDFSREGFRLRSQETGVTDANGCAWTSAGPTNLNGRVISIAIDPTNNQNIYAATVGGLWRSSTAGRRWQRVSDDILADRFGAVAVNPGAPNEILAAVGDPNMGIGAPEVLYRSTGYGAPGTWTKVTSVFDYRIVYRIRFDPAAPNDVYVAASNGVWLGTHDPVGGGITFKQDVLGNLDASTHDIAVDFSSMPRTIYAGVRQANKSWLRGIYKWDGVNHIWNKRDTGIDTSDSAAISIALSQLNPLILYAKVAQKSDASLSGLYRTTTAGEKTDPNTDAWTTLPLGEANGGVVDEWGWYNTMLEVDPSNPSRVFHGGTDIWMSGNMGGKWERIHLGKDPSYQLPAHADVHTLAFDPANPKIVYIGNDGGVDRSTDMSQATWHWTDVSHGMIITMFYTLTSNRAYPALLAGGMQDNGTSITFGNRTWYQPGGGDGYDVGTDAGNPDSLYSNGGGVLYEVVNPTPGTEGGYDPLGTPGNGPVVAWTGDKPTRPPLMTDIAEPHSALGGAGIDCGKRTIVKTTDGIDWKATDADLLPGGAPIVLASAPSAMFQTYLAAVAYRKVDNKLLPCVTPMTFNPYVIRTDDGGKTWTTVAGLPATPEPSSLVFDPDDKSRSYVTYRNAERIYMSTGGPYSQIAGTFPNALPNDVRRVAVDPFDTNVLYAATSVGMFRGVVTPGTPPAATWAPFDEGLPDGLEINDLWVDPQTGILTIGTFGFGAFRRDIRKDTQCAARMLVVRDCVNDDGRQPSPCGGPDPEHPIPNGNWNGGSYVPDDSYAGSAHWFASRDIRVDVPSKNPPANQIEDADSVEFELCPTAVAKCPPQSMIDSEPVGLKEARVYVQVTNRGVEPVTKTRVIALWSPSAAAFDSLPATFWTKTFPADGKCGPLDPGTSWQLVNLVEPCQTIATVTPDMPELARFYWNVPFAANGGATLLTITESPDDPLDPSIRSENKLAPDVIVPESRHIALRNLRIKAIKYREIQIPKMWPLDLLKLPLGMTEVEVVVSKPDLREPVRIVLPPGLTAQPGFGNVRRTRVTEPELLRQLEDMRLDPDNAWELSGDEASLFVDLERGQRVTTAVIATPDEGGFASQVSIVERSRGKIVGGSVMMMRPEE